ncbi:ABC transporter permease [Kordia sp.]|uniref:ABC transporter permease n=1 Tax=Kordia sp. TaxID=1965332 RepID=UPI003B5AE733
MKFYFSLQCKRIYRHIDEFGIIPILGFAGIGLLFVWLSEAVFKSIPQASFFYIGISLLLNLKLGSRKRTTFLKKCFPPNTFWKVRMIENTLFILPFSLFLCYKYAFLEVLLIHSGAIILSFINNIGIRSISIPTPFGKKPFEFIIGFRNTFWLFPLLYLLTYIGISVDNYNLGVFSLIIVFVCCLSFYSKPEPLYCVWIHSMTPKEFIFDKVKTALMYSSCLVLPIAIILSIFFSVEFIQITIAFVLLGYSFIILTILGKYGNYPSQIPILQMFALLISFMFPPIVLLFIPLFYRRAIKNLNSFLTC